MIRSATARFNTKRLNSEDLSSLLGSFTITQQVNIFPGTVIRHRMAVTIVVVKETSKGALWPSQKLLPNIIIIRQEKHLPENTKSVEEPPALSARESSFESAMNHHRFVAVYIHGECCCKDVAAIGTSQVFLEK